MLHVFNSERAAVDKEDLRAVTDARKCTLAIICELAVASTDGAKVDIAEHVKAALSDLHPTMSYNCNEKLIRDLAEICATFYTIENGRERSSRELVFEAKIFCDNMCDEISNFKRQ